MTISEQIIIDLSMLFRNVHDSDMEELGEDYLRLKLLLC